MYLHSEVESKCQERRFAKRSHTFSISIYGTVRCQTLMDNYDGSLTVERSDP